MLVAQRPDRVVEGDGGLAGVDAVVNGAEGTVEAVGSFYGQGVVDLPEGADDPGEAGEEERRGEVDRLVDQLRRAGEGGAAGGQVGQLRVIEPDRSEASDSERVGVVVVQQQQAIGGLTGSVAPWQAKWAIWQSGRRAKTLALVGVYCPSHRHNLVRGSYFNSKIS